MLEKNFSEYSAGEKEVEIEISTGENDGGTRASLDGKETDFGYSNEREINTLDVLVFDKDGKYLYRREASAISGTNTYRVQMKESDGTYDIHVLANYREVIRTKLGSIDDYETHKGKTWSDINAMLVDNNPERLVLHQSEVEGKTKVFPGLPMHGFLDDRPMSSTSVPTKWGTAKLRRSVASFDLFVEKNDDTTDFELTDLFVWYASDKGLLGAEYKEEDIRVISYGSYTRKDTIYKVPDGWATSLNASEKKTADDAAIMHANRVNSIVGGATSNSSKQYDAIAYQMYVYDNASQNTSSGNTKRPTRLIVAGMYPNPDNQQQRVKRYYPIDVVENEENAQGTHDYRAVIRNWKYEFTVTKVSGAGYETIEDAAKGAVVDINVDVIQWNKDDAAVGVQGKYYMSMDKKYVVLERNALNFKTLDLTYDILDDGSADFSMKLLNVDNGTSTSIQKSELAAGVTAAVKNEYFKVEMTQVHDATNNSGSVTFKITALKAYSNPENSTEVEKHYTDAVLVKFRNLEFKIDIFQIDGSEEDWGGGEQIPVNPVS